MELLVICALAGLFYLAAVSFGAISAAKILDAADGLSAKEKDDPEAFVRLEPQTFSVRSIDLREVFGNIQVNAVNGLGATTIEISGPRRLVNLYRVNNRLDKLLLWVDAGAVEVRDSTLPKIRIDTPLQLPVRMTLLAGKALIGDTHAPLEVRITGDAQVDAGFVSDATLSVTGSGSIVVENVQGRLSAEVTGDANICVNGGDVTAANASVTGNGTIFFNGTASTANCQVVGAGNVHLETLVEAPRKNIVGEGVITVGNW